MNICTNTNQICLTRRIVEAQIRVKRKNAQSTVLEQLDAETLGIFDTTKFVEDSLLASTSEPPPDPGHWQSHPAIMKGVRLEHMMELWCFLQVLYTSSLSLTTYLSFLFLIGEQTYYRHSQISWD